MKLKFPGAEPVVAEDVEVRPVRHHRRAGGGGRRIPTLTDCTPTRRRPTSLVPRRVLRTLYLCALAAVLCLGHLQLRFVSRDLKRETLEYQARSQALIQQVAELEREVARQSNLASIDRYARVQLGMTDARPEKGSVAALPPSLLAKYLDADPAGSDRHAADSEPHRGFLATLMDFNRAFAAVALRQQEEQPQHETK